MGLLDDAIREHLELKRRHGAPDSEIERAEQEALGPARRDPAAGAGIPALQEVPGDEIAPEDVPPPPPPPPVDDPVFADEYATEPAPAEFDEPEPEPVEPVAAEQELEEAPPPGTAKPHDPAIGDYDEPVVGADEPAREAPPDEPRGEGEEREDVLEETPEFLQDTPEHDKLWFEQKPPRDFDFE